MEGERSKHSAFPPIVPISDYLITKPSSIITYSWLQTAHVGGPLFTNYLTIFFHLNSSGLSY